MRNELTEIVFILDQSGSMSHLTKDTIGGFNSFIEQQKKEQGEALLTTVLFHNRYEVLHDGVDIKEVEPMTDYDYRPLGGTALYDAIGKTIINIRNEINLTSRKYRPSKVIFVITTDGYENSSERYSQQEVKDLIDHQTKEYDWQFLFLGANIDAVAAAEGFGIDAKYASDYTANGIGTQSLYSSVSSTVADYRVKGVVADGWKDDIK